MVKTNQNNYSVYRPVWIGFPYRVFIIPYQNIFVNEQIMNNYEKFMNKMFL